jgi:threonine dehydrogenase-like Zn-dependent dehydrogenase
MRALVVTGPGETEVAETAAARPARGEVVVRVDTCGICGSDVHAVARGRATAGQVLGHEFSGTISEIGEGVDGWRSGQRVAVNPLGSCGQCQRCRRGLPFWCEVPNIGLSAPGALAEYVAVPALQLAALPDAVALRVGARAEPLAVALNATARGHVRPGDGALVFGVGPIGLNVIVALRLAGAGTIVAVGRSAGRREAAGELGADVVLDGRQTDAAAYVAEHGLEIGSAYECAGSPDALATALASLSPGGVCVEVALTPQPVTISPLALLRNGLTLTTSSAFAPDTYLRAVELLADGRVPVERLVSARLGLSDAPGALMRLRDPGALISIAIEPWR